MREYADAGDLDALKRVFERLPDEAVKDVRKINRAAAVRLREQVRAVVPRTGGAVDHRHPASGARGETSRESKGRHRTRPGAMRTSVQAFSSITSAGVRGGGTKAPHFVVNEFGGAVWWSKSGAGLSARSGSRSHRSYADFRSRLGGSEGHIIPVRRRSPMNVVKRWGSMSNGQPVVKSKRFPEGWYFFKTAAKAIPDIAAQHVRDMQALTRRLFGKV